MYSPLLSLQVETSFRGKFNLSTKARRELNNYLIDLRGTWHTLDFKKMLSEIANNYTPIYKDIYRPQINPSPEAVTLAVIYLLAHQAQRSQDYVDSSAHLFQFAKDFSEAASKKGKLAPFTRAWTDKNVGISESEAGIIDSVCQDIINTPIDYLNPKPVDFEREAIKGELSRIFPIANAKEVQ